MMDTPIDVRLLRPGHDLEVYGDEVWSILVSGDKEFVPPLSARTSTTERQLTKESIWGGPISYFDAVMSQHVLLAFRGTTVVGLLSFIPHYTADPLLEWSPSTYASTAFVVGRLRRQGIGTALNEALENLPAEIESPWITRRTWSSNKANLQLLVNRGFVEVHRVENDRGPGVDTIYLARKTHSGETSDA